MVVVLCNCTPGEAPDLARTLVEERLAACVNVLPGVRSFYVWDGALCDDAESTLLVKVRADGVPALSDRIRALHSYSTPEILVLPVDVAASDPRYVAWVMATGTATPS
ncbi:MAG: divalent-cation tolerance protein CutA [Alphaproteobacteria bacterium]|nr:divalent-cation tolerance protein CutA [Alphaproteobacteria bacterium]MCB9694355.1 divalent-cation tolerance protein CutA [Alphaproteobacteria bacterium]